MAPDLKQTTKPHRSGFLPTLAIVLIAAAGFLFVLFCTWQGIGTSPDSAAYLGAAHNLLNGNGFSLPYGEVINQPLTHFPPLYPVLLALPGFLGVDPMDWARWFNAALFSANILLAATFIRKSSRLGGWAAVGMSLVFLSSFVTVTLHVMAWSEPLFLLLGFGGLLTLFNAITNKKWSLLYLAGLWIGLSAVTRYAGVAFILAGGIAAFFFQRGKFSQKMLSAVSFGIPASLPLLLWVARNWITAGNATSRELIFNPIRASFFNQVMETVASWFLLSSQDPGARKVLIPLLVIIMAIYLFLPRHSPDDQQTPTDGRQHSSGTMMKLLLIFMVVYTLFILASITFMDANLSIDNRILSPLYLSSILLILVAILDKLRDVKDQKWLMTIVLVGALAYSGTSIYQNLDIYLGSYQNGIGFNHSSWRFSPTIQTLASQPNDLLIYTNSPEAVFILTGRNSHGIPKKVDLVSRRENTNFQLDLETMAAEMALRNGRLIYFDQVQGASIPTLPELLDNIELIPVVTTTDGVIFKANER